MTLKLSTEEIEINVNHLLD